jgi:hypothetical protein
MLGKLKSQLAARPGLVFLLIFALAFLVRFAILLNVPRPNLRQAGEAGQIAQSLISKGLFADPYVIPTGPTAHTGPFFPTLLAGVFKLFGTGDRGHFARCILNICAYSLLYALFPALARAFAFPPSAGLIAGFASALLPTKASAEVFRGWEEPYAALILALAVLWTMRRWDSPRKTAAGAIWLGLIWGAALYVSFALCSVLIGLAVADLWLHRSPRSVRDTAVILAVAFAVTVPWLLRNHQQLHGWTLMRDNLGLELRYSNHDHAAASSTLLNADPASMEMHPNNSAREAMIVRRLGEIEYNRREMGLATEWIAAHPGDFIRLSIRRFLYFWLGPLEHPFELAITSAYTLVGLWGLVLLRKKVGRNQFVIWCTALACYPPLYYFVQYISRYRVPIDWLIWLSAGLAVSVLVERRFATGATEEKEYKQAA